MSPESGNRFRGAAMHNNKNLKRVARVRFDATRFRTEGLNAQWSNEGAGGTGTTATRSRPPCLAR